MFKKNEASWETVVLVFISIVWPFCTANERHKDRLAAYWSTQLHNHYTRLLAKGKENN